MKITLQKEYVLAAMCNGKEITEAQFEAQVGVPFHDFWNKNKKKCLEAWKLDQKLRPVKKTLDQKRKAGECVCLDEEALGPNDTRGGGKEKIRLWRCPVHKNIFKVFNQPDYE